MKRYKLLALFVTLLLVLSSQDIKITGQDSGKKDSLDSALKIITKETLKEYVEYLASDELEGRHAGKEGEQKATEYIAKCFKDAGLKAIGKDSNYFQIVGKSGKARNCVGFLEGTDPKLKDEIIVVGGHHDHVGKKGTPHPGQKQTKGNDPVYHGADDNASGTAITMVLAKAFGTSGVRTKRSILFITFTGEELGLLGSQHYAKNPLLPISNPDIKNHIAMINLDMVGMGPGKPLTYMGSNKFDDIIHKCAKSQDLEVKYTGKGGADSDHASFASKGIPAVFLFTGLHPYYHTPADTPDRLAYDKMAKIGKTTFLILCELGGGYDKVDKGPDKEPPKPDSPPVDPSGIDLGIGSEELSGDELGKLQKSGLIKKGNGGIKVTSVSEGSVAKSAGIKDRDIIISFLSQYLPEKDPLSKLKSLLSKVERGKTYNIEIIRDGKKVSLKATWQKIKK